MISLPNMIHLEDHELEQYVIDLQFHVDTYQAWLTRAEAEVRQRRLNKRRGVFTAVSVPLVTTEPKPH